ncbi:interleukin 17a/f2, partial [Antennarius striatus]|uniref:interleukin 17a/f2 n=1 Tax=Antennarius striatus TaxID=241820 RepID=UPI0035B4F7D8
SPQVCCNALWVVSSSRVKAPPPPGCDSVMVIPSPSSSSPFSSTNGSTDVHSRSLSPWKWSSTTVKNRIPATIWEAECSSTGCSAHSPTDGRRLSSVPVYQEVLVLQRLDRKSCYRTRYRSVAVGCTCIWTRT